MLVREAGRRLVVAGGVLYKRTVLALENLIKRLPDGDPPGWQEHGRKHIRPPWPIVAITIVTLSLFVYAIRTRNDGRANAVAGVCIFFATAIYAYLAFKQWRVTEGLLRQNREHLLLTQRASISIGSIVFATNAVQLELQNNGPADLQVVIKQRGYKMPHVPEAFGDGYGAIDVPRGGSRTFTLLVPFVEAMKPEFRVVGEIRGKDCFGKVGPYRYRAKWEASVSHYVREMPTEPFPAWGSGPEGWD